MEHEIELEKWLSDSGWLRKLAARLVGEGGADDLVQETWLAALRRPMRSLEEPRPWLARVARNLAATTRRGTSRREARERDRHAEAEVPTPDELARAAEAQRLVAEAVTRLEPTLRAVVVLCYYQGLDSRAAAQQLGVPASTLRTRLQRALEALRGELDRERGRKSWMLLLVPLTRRAQPLAGASAPFAALTLAGTAGGLALVGALGYLAWPARETGNEEASRATVAERLAPPVKGTAALDGTPPGTMREAVEEETHKDASTPPSRTSARLSGTLLVDGEPPEWPIQLTLSSKVPAALPGPLVPLLRPSPPSLVLAPEEGGRFAFEGLPLDWGGRLEVEWFSFLDGTYSQSFDAPAEGLMLQLTAKPQILGRLIAADGSPVGGVEIAYQRSVESFGTLWSSTTTLPDGRFRIWLPVQGSAWRMNAAFVEVGLDQGRTRAGAELALVADAGARGWLELETSFDPATGLDLGELVLEPVRERALRVRAPDGTPLESACARIEVAGPRIGCACVTDEAGLGSMHLPERTSEVRVSHFGFADRLVSVAPTDALEFVLEPLTVLHLTLPAPELDVLVLRSAAAAFVWDPTDGPDRDYQENEGARGWNERTPAHDGEPWRYRWELGQPTTLTLVGLVPERTFELELLDQEGRSLAVQTLRLAAGERAEFTLGGVPEDGR